MSVNARRLVTAVFAVALTIPAETILVRAIAPATPQAAARAWASSLAPVDLKSAASVIEAYPLAYRRAIMAALTPEARAAVWRLHIAMYIQAHPTLDGATLSDLDAAIALITPASMATPTDDVRAAIHQIAADVTASIGADQAQYLFGRLGPPDGAFASAVPVGERLTTWARRIFTVKADGFDCDCNLGYGCPDLNGACGASTGCSPYSSWPACGWLWEDACNGGCQAGMGGS
jgi:hypothetical protein